MFLLLSGESMVEASTTKVSSKGQVVIPANVRKAANLKKGEKLLAIAIDDTVVLKKIIDKSFEETMKPVWVRVRQMGLSEEDINALIDEARAKSSS
jgi:AbrB family looped-hinge helix DNA binding protein